MTEINFEDEYNKLKYILNSGKINDHIFKSLYGAVGNNYDMVSYPTKKGR